MIPKLRVTSCALLGYQVIGKNEVSILIVNGLDYRLYSNVHKTLTAPFEI
jgi:hypothetical protein